MRRELIGRVRYFDEGINHFCHKDRNGKKVELVKPRLYLPYLNGCGEVMLQDTHSLATCNRIIKISPARFEQIGGIIKEDGGRLLLPE